MKNKHKFLTVLLIIVLCVTMSVSLIACNKDNDTNETIKDTGEFITNGNFVETTSDEFPKIPSSWTASAGSTTSGNEVETDNKALVSGVIDTNVDVYDKDKKKWDRLPNPAAVATTDSNILMIYNKKATSYKYTSSSFSLDANKIFKIDISVKTVNIPDDSYGAYIKIGSNAFIEFERIKTNGNWVTYSAMIKTSNISSNSIDVTLSNGRDGKNDGKLSTGYALFDNVVVTEVKDIENGDTAEDQYNKFVEDAKESPYLGYDDLLLGDSSFKNVSGTSNPFTARRWTGISSTGADGETAPTGSDYLERGVVDTNITNSIPSVATNVSAHDADGKMLMINNKKATAYGYRNDSKIKISPDKNGSKYYKLSVWVLTKDIEGKGAYIRLKTSTDKNEQIKTIDSIVTDGEWSQISFYIKSDAKRNKEIYLQLGLGTGGKNDLSDLVQGTAFFDEITLEECSESDYNGADAKNQASLESNLDSTNLINESEIFSPDNYDKSFVLDNYNKNDGFELNERGTLTIANNEITITNDKPTITRYRYTKNIEIAANNHYRLSFLIKTDILDSDKGIDIKFYKKTPPTQANGGKDTELTNLAISGFNTSDVDESLLNDGFVEVAFLIQGDLKEVSNIYFEIIIGSGNNLTPDTLVKGSVIIKGFELYKVNYADYNSESTGSYVKKHSLKSDSTQSITNGDFNLIDISATKTQYEKIEVEFDENDFLGQNTKAAFGLPQNWTTSSSDEEYIKNLNAGIINDENLDQKKAIGFTGDIKSGLREDIAKDNDNFLVIHAKNDLGGAWGFTSSSISIAKGTYYELSVWAYLVRGSSATINLKSSSKTTLQSYEITSSTTGWQQYFFYINAGFDNSSIYLELLLGTEEASQAYGTVLFDRPVINSIPLDLYEKAEKLESERVKTITFSTTTFDNVTSSDDNNSLDTPDGWTGSHADTDAPNGEHKSIAGVYNRDHGNRNWFGSADTDNTEATDRITEQELITIMNTVPTVNDPSQIEGTSNNNVLVIHNNVASEYTYKTTLTDNSLQKNKFFEISLYVLTYKVDVDKTARIQLKLHNSTYEFSLNEARGIKVNTDSKWVKYSFFIATEDNADIDSVELSVSLGTSGEKNYVAGYLFVDNVTISEITEDKYNDEVPEGAFKEDAFNKDYTSTKYRILFTTEDLNKDAEDDDDKDVDPLLWLYITSGIIGGLLVIVVVVVLLRKFNVFARFSKKDNFAEKGNETYNRNKVEENKANAQSRDINKKHQD